jgi:Tfp pilus assembly protein PilP
MVTSVCAALAACSVESPMQAETPPAKRRQDAGTASLEGLSPNTDEEPYAYDSSGRRDPFIPLIAATKVNAEVQEKLNCPPLQDFELATLKLVAIEGPKRPRIRRHRRDAYRAELWARASHRIECGRGRGEPSRR